MKLIKSKIEVTINPMTGLRDFVYLSVPQEQKSETEEIVSYLVCAFTGKMEGKKSEENLVLTELPTPFSRIPAIYKLSTWMKLFGDVTPNEFEANKGQFMIEQVVYNSSKFWGLGADDWEVVK